MHRDHPPLAGLARCFQHGGNLHRVMTIIVNDGHPIHLANFGEAAVDAFERGQGIADFALFHTQMPRDRDRGQSI